MGYGPIKRQTSETNKNWLVVWLPFFIFPYIGFLIIPTDVHIFQRGGPVERYMSWVPVLQVTA